MSSIKEIIDLFPSNLQDPMLQFWSNVKDELGIKREDFTELKNIVFELGEAQRELAKAQNRTEQRVEELAQAQLGTERAVQYLSRTIDFKLGGLGRRWGLDSERSFRRGLTDILSETGYEVHNYLMRDMEGFVFGHPSEIEIDVIVYGDKIIVGEIKASVSKSDVHVFVRKAEFYSRDTGKRIDTLLIITPFIDDDARPVADIYQIVVCDSISDLEQLDLS